MNHDELLRRVLELACRGGGHERWGITRATAITPAQAADTMRDVADAIRLVVDVVILDFAPHDEIAARLERVAAFADEQATQAREWARDLALAELKRKLDEWKLRRARALAAPPAK